MVGGSIITDFRIFLQEELARRCKKNPKYSLRAFARYLQVEPSFLSKILNGNRNITEKTISKFGEALGLHPLDIEKFKISLLPKRSKARWVTKIDDLQYQQLTQDKFQLIADWYHYAILELMLVKNFKPTISWVAKSLGISVAETKAAVDRLVRLGFLEIKRDGSWKNRSGLNTTISNKFSTAAFRILQRQVLEMGVEAMETIPYEERDQSSMTVAVDAKLLLEAKQMIKSFRRRLAKYLKEKGTPDEVYQLGISLYPVSNANGK